MSQITKRSYQDIKQALLNNQELALIDVREEAIYAKNHPLFAINISLSRLELEVYSRIPRLTTAITVYDNGEGLAEIAAKRLIQLGYQNIALLEGGLNGWRKAKGELFQDVNVPSKAFGELVESKRNTPAISAEQVQQLINNKKDIVIVDVRRFDEYQTMSIPTATSVPGGELILCIAELAPNPHTQVIVNCAGRTRSIIGTQSLINVGIKNPVAALRNGTIGWTLAGNKLEHQQTRQFKVVSEQTKQIVSKKVRSIFLDHLR